MRGTRTIPACRDLCRAPAAALQAVAFWAAALLPLAYLPAAIGDWWVLWQLLALHVGVIVVGHGHRARRPAVEDERR